MHPAWGAVSLHVLVPRCALRAGESRVGRVCTLRFQTFSAAVWRAAGGVRPPKKVPAAPFYAKSPQTAPSYLLIPRCHADPGTQCRSSTWYGESDAGARPKRGACVQRIQLFAAHVVWHWDSACDGGLRGALHTPVCCGTLFECGLIACVRYMPCESV